MQLLKQTTNLFGNSPIVVSSIQRWIIVTWDLDITAQEMQLLEDPVEMLGMENATIEPFMKENHYISVVWNDRRQL